MATVGGSRTLSCSPAAGIALSALAVLLAPLAHHFRFFGPLAIAGALRGLSRHGGDSGGSGDSQARAAARRGDACTEHCGAGGCGIGLAPPPARRRPRTCARRGLAYADRDHDLARQLPSALAEWITHTFAGGRARASPVATLNPLFGQTLDRPSRRRPRRALAGLVARDARRFLEARFRGDPIILQVLPA